jgi:hypothetical protein
MDLKKLARENTVFLKRLARVKKPPARLGGHRFSRLYPEASNSAIAER